MNKIIIIADSTCDLEPEYVEKNDIVLTPLHDSFAGDDHDYLDDYCYNKFNQLIEGQVLLNGEKRRY